MVIDMTRLKCFCVLSSLLFLVVDGFLIPNGTYADGVDPFVPDPDIPIIDFNMDDRMIPSRFQTSYPLLGLRCFPDGLRLPCDCEMQHICPCCIDYETEECYAATYYMWSEWMHCNMDNAECDDTQECRVKYDQLSPHYGTDQMVYRRRKRRGIYLDDQHYHMHDDHECQVQRAQCRLRQYGEWGSWSQVGECSSGCFVGTVHRERACLDPSSEEVFSPDLCPGGEEASTDNTLPCNTDACVATTEWEYIGRCYNHSGDCVMDQIRQCFIPHDAVFTEECSVRMADCPLDCSLLGKSGYLFGEWSPCNATCSPGSQTRVGECIYLIDDFPSTECDEVTKIEIRECETALCSDYSEWIQGPCSAECNGGSANITRSCDHSGVVPPGCLQNEVPCHAHPCTSDLHVTIITGSMEGADTRAQVHLTVIGTINTVSETLNDNTNEEGSPRFGLGATDEFDFTVLEVGQIQSIVLGHDDTGSNASWHLDSAHIIVGGDEHYNFPCGTWMDSSIGDQKTSRTLYPGEQCHQENFFYVYTEWSACSESCSPGYRQRQGTCLDNTTGEVSDNCGSESITETDSCNMGYCETYNLFTSWSTCSASCGIGSQDRQRNCSEENRITPQHCLLEERSCSLTACVGPGAWSNYTACNNTCSPGVKTRTRECFELGTDVPATGCTEPLVETTPCNTHLCDSYSAFVAEDPTACSGNRDGDVCGARKTTTKGTCDGTGTYSDECLSSTTLCGNNARPGENVSSDIYFSVDNDYNLAEEDEILCGPTQLERLTEVKKLIERFVCSFYTFDDLSMSQFAITTSPTAGIEKAFNDPHLFTALDQIPRHCRNTALIPVFGNYRNLITRPGAKQAIIIILSKRSIGDLQTQTTQLQSLWQHFAPPGDAVHGMIAAFDVDSETLPFLRKLACHDSLHVGPCMHYFGTIRTPIEEIIEKLTELWEMN